MTETADRFFRGTVHKDRSRAVVLCRALGVPCSLTTGKLLEAIVTVACDAATNEDSRHAMDNDRDPEAGREHFETTFDSLVGDNDLPIGLAAVVVALDMRSFVCARLAVLAYHSRQVEALAEATAGERITTSGAIPGTKPHGERMELHRKVAAARKLADDLARIDEEGLEL